jgi:hypothetical protein
VFTLLIGGFHGRDGMGTKKLLITFVLAIGCAVLAAPGMAATIPSGVTIHHSGHHRLFGYVFSQETRCAKERRVRVFRQIGKEQNRRRDHAVGEEGSFKAPNGKYRWTYGRSHIRGRYYAVITKRHGCKGDASRTIHLKR